MALTIKKLDLHVHTPASHDFQDKSVLPEQIVDKAISMGLDAIAVTDHNSVDWVDKVKKSAEKKNLTIFPGIEISCGGSKRGTIHVIGIFDIDKNKDDLQKVVGRLEIKGSGKDALTDKSVNDVIKIIKDNGGLSVLAHANSTKGALSDIRGNPRKEIIKNPGLLAVEATEADFKKEEGKRLIDILSSNNPVYKRRLAVYQSSDNRSPNGYGHCVESTGKFFTFLKMEELKLESLRECFEDPYTRILQSYEVEKTKSEHPRILEVEMKGGFLSEQKFCFHSGINSIIGGTGTGKSLIIEFLRFGFNKKPDNQILWKDHKTKIEKRLGIGNSIIIRFCDQYGEEYELTRECGASKDLYESPIVCFNKSTGEKFNGDINSIFPLLIYSQSEILAVTQDTRSQLKLLDSFREDFKKYQTRIEEIGTGLGKLDYELSESIRETVNIDSLKKELKTIKEQIGKMEKKIKSKISPEIFDSFKELEKERETALTKISEYEEIVKNIDQLIIDSRARKVDPIKYKLVRKVESQIKEEYSFIVESLKEIKKHIEKKKRESIDTIKLWQDSNKFEIAENRYKEALKTKKQERGIEIKRKNFEKEKKEVQKKISKAISTINQINELQQRRNKLLTELVDIRKSYFEERCKQVVLVNERSEGKLNIEIISADDTEKYKENLLKLKVHSHAEEREIEKIVKEISPIDFVNFVLDNNAKEIARLTQIKETKVKSIILVLKDPLNLQKTIALQHESYPDDRIEISYQKKDKKYYPLSELSMGQKADALIMIALIDSAMPVIIDQPEDALDIPSIWSDICAKLRTNKHIRQFIFTTHNSSIAVSSDSDQFIVMKAKANKGWISETGSIDKEKIKKEAISHLEGGDKSYDLKRRKYGL